MLEQRSDLATILLLARINHIDSSVLRALSRGLSHSSFTLFESLAQAASYHARHLSKLERHTFVAEFSDMSLVPPFPNAAIELEATLTASSHAGCAYTCQALHDGRRIGSGTILIGLRDYDQQFRRDVLHPHYQRVFQCLLND